MTPVSALPSSPSERLSALVDGESDPTAAAAACADWRADAAARVTWHRYQLIGDLLRSDDLASTGARDEAFLVALRGRLALEPVVLAPEPLRSAVAETANGRGASGRTSERSARRGGWIASGAIAAGFVAVAGVLLVTRGPEGSDASVASASIAALPVTTPTPLVVATVPVVAAPAAASPAVPSEAQPPVASGKMIRDAGLDRYLAAHKQFAGSSALGVPSAFLRNATADATRR